MSTSTSTTSLREYGTSTRLSTVRYCSFSNSKALDCPALCLCASMGICETSRRGSRRTSRSAGSQQKSDRRPARAQNAAKNLPAESASIQKGNVIYYSCTYLARQSSSCPGQTSWSWTPAVAVGAAGLAASVSRLSYFCVPGISPGDRIGIFSMDPTWHLCVTHISRYWL